MAKKIIKPSGKFLIPRTKKVYPKKDCTKCGDDVFISAGKYFHRTPLCSKCYNMESKLGKYKITESDYNNMLQRQGGMCALCQKESVGYIDKYTKMGKPLVIDHCHKTGGVRGYCVLGATTDLECLRQLSILVISKQKEDFMLHIKFN